MNEHDVDFFDFFDAFYKLLSEYDPSHENYNENNKDIVVWRDGQLFFNFLSGINPRVADLLRGSLIDPFHRDEVSDKVWDLVMDKWEAEVV